MVRRRRRVARGRGRPALKGVPANAGEWKCPKCVSCLRCGTKKPGKSGWKLGYKYCEGCAKLHEERGYCKVCKQDCRYEEGPMVCCDGVGCGFWVHAECDGISEGGMDMITAKGEKWSYHCPDCRHEEPGKYGAWLDTKVPKRPPKPPPQPFAALPGTAGPSHMMACGSAIPGAMPGAIPGMGMGAGDGPRAERSPRAPRGARSAHRARRPPPRGPPGRPARGKERIRRIRRRAITRLLRAGASVRPDGPASGD